MHKTVGLFSIGIWAIVGCSPEVILHGGEYQFDQETPSAECARENLTARCDCANDRPGRQICHDGAWSKCDCGDASSREAVTQDADASSSADASENSVHVSFDWKQTETARSTRNCKAGHYEGGFMGSYGPGIPVLAELKVIPVMSVDLPGIPGLVFDLTSEGKGERFTVSNGKMSGNSWIAFRIEADLEGDLDCDTLKFDAKLVDGHYVAGTFDCPIEGRFTADYDDRNQVLINGIWEVTEPAYPGAGGTGTWTVHRVE